MCWGLSSYLFLLFPARWKRNRPRRFIEVFELEEPLMEKRFT